MFQEVKNKKKVILTIQNLRTVLSGKWVHKGINLEIYKNEIFVILGESGQGKSVLLKIIMGFLEALTGSSVIFNGVDLLKKQKKKDLNELRAKIGMLFQGKTLFDSVNIYKNISFPLEYPSKKGNKKFIQSKVMEKISQVGLEKDILDQYPSEISYGAQKRVSLARVLLRNPEIMLYDEPTTGLDPITAAIIRKLILKVRDETKITSIVVTHDLETAFTIGDRIMMLHDGVILSTGEKSKFFEHKNLYIQEFLKDFKKYPPKGFQL